MLAAVPRLLHTADWQIGKPYRWIDNPERRSRLQRARLEAIERIIDQAQAHAVDVVLVAGDLFDSSTVGSALVMEALELIGSLSVPVVVIPGNHDHGGAGGVWRRPDVQREIHRRATNLHLLLQPEPVVVGGLTVLPCPLRRQHETVSPGAWLEHLDWSTLDADRARVVLAHGSVQGFAAADYDASGDSGRNQLNPKRWDLDAYDYLALGDWHALKPVGPKGWYPGTPEPDRFPTHVDDQRAQVLIVDVERQQPPQVKVVPTGGLQWHRLEAPLRSGHDLDRLHQQITNLTGRRVGRDLLRLELNGQLGLDDHHNLQDLLSSLDTRLLHLRVRGHCHRRPEASELSALLNRADAPLMSSIAEELQAGIRTLQPEQTDQIALLETALCELHRLCQDADIQQDLEEAA